MKKSILILLLTFTTSFTVSVAEVSPIANGYHVVVATFNDRQEKEARQLSESLNKKGFSSGYGLEKGKRFIYVFLQSFNFTQYSAAVKAMTEARKKNEFATAWVVKIKDGREIKEGEVVANTTEVAPQELEFVPEIITEYIPNPPADPIPNPQNLSNTPIFLSVYRSRDDKNLNAEINVYDPDNAKLLATLKSNSYMNLSDPKTKTGRIKLVASAFGYSDVPLEVGYRNTEKDTVQKNVVYFGSYFQFKFPMEKLKTGENVALSKVSFFNDAAIMIPTSKDQLVALLDMLQESPTMRIRINGHTNGNDRGKIIYVGPNKNYFGLTYDRIEKSGSSKELSTARAQVIKDWLMAQGIAESRVEALGWGGTKPLYSKNSPNARKNGRVELEIIN
jgi:outer membrane protein OmpA-like peptidoglycan-associated protein